MRAFNLLLLGMLLDHFGASKIQIGFIRVLQQIAIRVSCWRSSCSGKASARRGSRPP